MSVCWGVVFSRVVGTNQFESRSSCQSVVFVGVGEWVNWFTMTRWSCRVSQLDVWGLRDAIFPTFVGFPTF